MRRSEFCPAPNPLPSESRERGRGLRRRSAARESGAWRQPALSRGKPHLSRRRPRAHRRAGRARAIAARTPLVATSDVLYHAPHRRPLQDVLTCIREKTTHRRGGPAARSQRRAPPQTRRRRWRACSGATKTALARTLEIVEACTFSLDELVYEYPDEPVPPGKTPQAHLEDLAWEGARWRFPDGIPDKVHATIAQGAGADRASSTTRRTSSPCTTSSRYARSQGILCQGRGSAANSVVCYCLGITAVNPTEIDLLFERFVSPERKRAARHRRRFRARAARGGDPVHLRPLRPRPRRHRRDRHLLPRALGRPRRRQGDGAVGGYRRRARRHGLGHDAAAASCPKSTCAPRASIPPIRCSRPCSN